MKNSIITYILKKNDLGEEEWDYIENTVKESEVNLYDMLEQWSKVIEGYNRINENTGKVHK